VTDNLSRQAALLARRPYTVQLLRDETTTGEPVFVAMLQELEGCMAQGDSIDEAIDALEDAKLDFIATLLEDGIPVPDPVALQTSTTQGVSTILRLTNKGDQAPPQENHTPLVLFHAALITE